MSAALTPLLDEAASLYDQVKVIYLNPKSTAEDIEKAKKIRADADALTGRASDLKQIELAAEGIIIERKAASDVSQQQASAGFKSWGEFVKAVAKMRDGYKDPRFKYFSDPEESKSDDGAGRMGQKDMSGGSLAGGGALIPVENYNQLMAVAGPLAIIRSRATVLRMQHRQIEIPVLDQTVGAAGKPAFFGGIQIYWQEEASSATVSDAKFRRAVLTANKMIGYTRVSNELLADADPTLSDFLGGPLGFPGAVAWYEDYSFLQGSGAGQPQGIINAPGSKTVNRNTAATIKFEDLVGMNAGFMGQRPVWIATQAAKSTLMLMAGPSATNYAGFYLWGSASGGLPDQLLGYPIFYTDKQPAIGTKGDLILADLTYYLIGDRQATEMLSTPYEKVQTDQTSFRITHRVDGQPWLSAPLTLSDGTITVSPLVVLN